MYTRDGSGEWQLRDLAAMSREWAVSPSGLLVVPAGTRPCYDRPVGVDLFAGCGGFSLGFHQAGYHMAAAIEYDVSAALTYMVNLARPGVQIHFDTTDREAEFTRAAERHLGLRGGNGNAMSASAPRGQKGKIIQSGMLAGDGWISGQPPGERGCEHFWIADVRTLTGRQILDALGLRQGEVDVVVGGPPCQGFSVANSKRSVMDPRNSLVFEFARLCLEIRPKAFVMENVPQVATMLTPEGVPVIDALARVMADGGFGSYNALKQSLQASAGLGAALRRDAPKGGAADKDAETPEAEQEALFEL
jgi:DNA (cytosine-5)-methyltransferase 1